MHGEAQWCAVKIIESLRDRHRRDYMAAADNYAAWLHGEDTEAADVGGMEIARFISHQIAFVEAHDQSNQPQGSRFRKFGR